MQTDSSPVIPFLDLQAGYVELKAAIDAAVHRVLQSGWYILGGEVAGFEQAFAAYAGAERCIGVANGLDAIMLALRCCGIRPGDEVIVPANTYIATWLAVTHVGAIPVPVDPDPSTYCLTAEAAAAALTAKTKVVLPVHLYGHPADMDGLSALCRTHGLKLVEDAAQAHGAALNGVRIGSHGDAVAWSFYPGKNLGALGDGGGVTTNDSALARRVATLRNYGSSEKYVNETCGFNSRLDPLQAAVLSVKLEHLEHWNARRARVAAFYTDALAGTDIMLPEVAKGATHAWHLYVIQHERRDALQKALREQGVETLIHYPIPPFLQQAYRDFAPRAGTWPISSGLARRCLSLPMGPHLSTESAARVAEAVRAALRII